MTRRAQQIEQVIANHLALMPHISFLRNGENYPQRHREWMTKLVTDLLTVLQPAPDRAGLEAIFRKHEWHMDYPFLEEKRTPNPRMMDDLLRWAGAEPEPKVCDHYWMISQQGGEVNHVKIPDGQCPMCAPRPAEARG